MFGLVRLRAAMPTGTQTACTLRCNLTPGFKAHTLNTPTQVLCRHFSQTSTHTAERKGLAGLWKRYGELLETNPFVTKGITAGIIGGVGDVCCQKLVDKVDEVNWKRTGMFVLINGIYVAPTIHVWYNLIARTIGRWGGMQGVFAQLAADQLLFAPAFISSFTALLLAVEGRAADLPGHLAQHLWSTLIANWQIWVPANYVNFRYVPLAYRVLFGNGVSLVWNTYLSYATHKSVEPFDSAPPENIHI
eukprot:comp6722_c0_seq1/m.2496 comp6722_c0_seq1/g.2496  ORF comp6722_c0_seq1/g.2496 comp6722_c0_seq1/m.2496 type:complete len:247 (-) comp6722_c0_seq1:444-1184(-)